MNFKIISFLKLGVFLIICVLTIEGIIIKKRHGPPPPPPPARSLVSPTWGKITQRLDHFNPADNRTWTMRYIYNAEFFKKGGPIFIYLGGEWEIEPNTLTSGQIYDMAEEHNGYMFYTEHRYYGNSFPTRDTSTRNLVYLSSNQAMADVIYFIDYMKSNIRALANSKVVVVGCSYAGSLATWIRLKYPHVIDAAYASSGPVKAVANFYEYLDVVGNRIGLVSKPCLETIRNGKAQLEAKLKTKNGIREMSERLQTCTNIRNEEPYRTNLFNAIIINSLSNVVQYDDSTSILKTCNKLLAYKGTPLDKIISFARAEYSGYCIGDYDYDVEIYKNESITNNTYDENRCWSYQTCTEFGFFQTTRPSNQPFGQTSSLDYYTTYCRDLFGARFGRQILDSGIKRTNLFYGSKNPEVTKVVSVHGTGDPWHPLGILEDLNPLAPAILVKGSSHCADLSSVDDFDSPELRAAKIRVKKLIAEWIRN